MRIPIPVWCFIWIGVAFAMINSREAGWNAGVKACLDAGSLCSKMYEGAK